MTNTSKRAVATTLCISIYGTAPVMANTWYVKPDGSGGAPTIRAALDSATAGDIVLVAAGAYTWTTQGGDTTEQRLKGARLISMTQRSDITIRSESGPSSTIMDAEGQGRIFFLDGVLNVRIEGFTLRGGRALDPYGTGSAYGIGSGGAVHCRVSSQVVIENNIIIDNYAQKVAGGISIFDTEGSIVSNVVARNRALIRSGGIEISGSGANVLIRGNTIVENEGAAISCLFGNATITENILALSSHTANGVNGHAIWCLESEPAMSCNDLWGNVGSNAPCGIDMGGNTSTDPHFCVTSAEYAVRPDSPCLPANNPCSVLIGARDVGCEVTDSEGMRMGVADVLRIAPNPVHGRSVIHYSVSPEMLPIQLMVYDMRGRLVARILPVSSAATGSMIWDGRDDAGQPVPGGVYVVRIPMTRPEFVQKLVMLR